MKVKRVRLQLCILGLAVVFANTCRSRVEPSDPNILVVDAIVERIGKNPGVGSGVFAVYQFAKYKVAKVCAGEYTRSEIVVDHVVMTAEELNNLRVGDRVRLSANKSKTIYLRNNEEGFRKVTHEVDEFYIGSQPTLLSSVAPCANRAPNCV